MKAKCYLAGGWPSGVPRVRFLSPRQARPAAQAFTRLELVVVVGMLSIFVTMLWPAVCGTRMQAHRVTCLNNLRQIGQGFHAWAGAHEREYPWAVPASAGGTGVELETGARSIPLTGTAWFHFAALSNELASPRMLVCPADLTRKLHSAQNWGARAGGYLNLTNRHRSLSYFAGLHANAEQPDSLLSGDRHVRVLGLAYCRPGINSAAVLGPQPNVGWTNRPHGDAGHFLRNDGRVELVSNSGMIGALSYLRRDQTHLLIP